MCLLVYVMRVWPQESCGITMQQARVSLMYSRVRWGVDARQRCELD